MMEKKVVCYIQAFDCEKTIEAAMNSILKQTYENWLCFVLSNGNTGNHSLDVIRSVAGRDSRFIVLNKRKNNIDQYMIMLYYLSGLFPNSYICSLDADDEYKPGFFAEAVAMAEENHLDIVACGTDMIQKKNVSSNEERLLRKREIKENTVICGESLCSQFKMYRSFFNEMWGKLYRTELLADGRTYNERYMKKNFSRRFLPDTLFTMDVLKRCSRIGILAGTMHRFFQFEERESTNATTIVNELKANQRSVFRMNHFPIYSPYMTYEKCMDFLKSRGTVNPEVYEYMQAVLFGWLCDVYSRTLLLTTDEAKLSAHAYHMVFHPEFDKLMEYRAGESYRNLENYRKRIEFCESLKYFLLCQDVLKNKGNRLLRKQIDKTVGKLERTLGKLKELQSGGE